ncbi:MAG: hypothetical protein ABEJ03_04535 [Candidatus Nanohaloarchaea archaeon]
MGLFDDVKDSLHRGSDSSSSGNSGGSSESSSGSGTGFDSSEFDSSFEGKEGSSGGNTPPTGKNADLAPETPGKPGGRAQEQRGSPQSGRQGGRRQQGSSGRRSQDRNGQRSERRRNSRGKGTGTPNAQAGRPEPGSTEPQVSSNTRKKMENAGLDVNGGQRRNDPSQPVSDQMDDIQELKSQNEQIIELLKRISQSLQNQTGQQRGTGRRQ